MAFQDPLLFSGTVSDNIAYGLRVRGLRGAALRARVDEMVELLQLGIVARQRADRLSGGEAHRTALARAMAIAPELLLLDEPFAGLDPPIRETLHDPLSALLRRRGTTCVLVTHSRDEAFALADHIAVVEGGRLRQLGTADVVHARPATAFAARFVQMGNLLPARVTGSDAGVWVLDVAGRSVLAATASPPPPGVRLLACVRPESLDVRLAGAPPDAGTNRLAGTVERMAPRGGSVTVDVDCGTILRAVVGRPRVAEALRPGAAVEVRFPYDAVHLVPDDRSGDPP
jgi:ABC-type Fe3+/spermidine/putrescine transport system ATPase subunit